jgi:hypothetical protein
LHIIILIPIILIALVVLFRNVILNKFYKIIDEKFESEYNKRTNKFIRIFISNNKKRRIYHENTDIFRKKVKKFIDNIAAIMIIVLLAVVIFLCFKYINSLSDLLYKWKNFFQACLKNSVIGH